MKLFHKPQDYQAFVDLLGEALDRVPGMRLLGWCLMPNQIYRIQPMPRRAGGAGAIVALEQFGDSINLRGPSPPEPRPSGSPKEVAGVGQ